MKSEIQSLDTVGLGLEIETFISPAKREWRRTYYLRRLLLQSASVFEASQQALHFLRLSLRLHFASILAFDYHHRAMPRSHRLRLFRSILILHNFRRRQRSAATFLSIWFAPNPSTRHDSP